MKRVISRKQRSNEAEWQNALLNIENIISLEEVDILAKRTIAEIKAVSSGKRVGYGWSGGKDSIVLASLCERAGIHNSVFIATELEYPAFMEWAERNKPKGCKVYTCPITKEWLKKNPQMLFPSKPYWETYADLGHRKGWSEFIKNEKLDIFIVGNRKADGNICGKGNFIRKNNGEVRFNAIADWPHEAVLGYIHYNGLEMPPIYSWKNGFRRGTHCWSNRRVQSIRQGFDEVMEIDPNIIVEASKWLEQARLYLKGELIDENRG